MTSWKPDALSAIADDSELRVAAHRPDGTLRTPVIVWHVVIEGDLYLRSVRGDTGAWYRGVQRTGTGTIESTGVTVEVTFTRDSGHDAAVDRAYHVKYGDTSAVRSITSPEATATTLRVEPR